MELTATLICDLNKKNELSFQAGNQDGYRCVICGNSTCLDDSYSSRGFNLTCLKCVNTRAAKEGISPAEYGRRYIWEGVKLEELLRRVIKKKGKEECKVPEKKVVNKKSI